MERTMRAKVAYDFSGLVVAISGAAGGFGSEMARRFCDGGARLVLLDRSADDVRARNAGIDAEAFGYDQADPSSIEDVAMAMSLPDVLVNNAGFTIRKPLLDMSTAEITRLIDVNLTGAVLLATRIAGRMAASGRGGTIVNMSSQLAYSGGENRAIYSLTKAGLVQFTKSAAAEWARHGIRVCGLAPGAADTPMTADLQQDAAAMAKIGARVPSGRMIPAGEIADLALFLASGAAQSVVGQTLIADDGYLLT